MSRSMGPVPYVAAVSARNLQLNTLAGIAFAALLPALFWPFVLSFALAQFGVVVSGTALLASGVAIALFLTTVVAPIMMRGDSTAPAYR